MKRKVTKSIEKEHENGDLALHTHIYSLEKLCTYMCKYMHVVCIHVHNSGINMTKNTRGTVIQNSGKWGWSLGSNPPTSKLIILWYEWLQPILQKSKPWLQRSIPEGWSRFDSQSADAHSRGIHLAIHADYFFQGTTRL